MDVDNAIRGRDDRLRSSPVIGTIKSESPGIPNAPSREFSDGPSGASNVDIDDDWPESEELILSPDPNAIDYDATESESQGSPRSEHSQDEAINHIDDQPQADEMSSRSQDNVGLTKPSDNAELRHIITTIDKRHCLKFRWYVARHLRSNFDSAHILTRQHYYMRIIKGHHFVESNNGDTKGVVLQRLRKTPLNRLDYEITRAHLDSRETVDPNVRLLEKRRVAPHRLLMVLRQAPSQYGWDEVVTENAVDNVLKQSGVFDLDAFAAFQESAPSPSPSLIVPAEGARAQELYDGDGDEDSVYDEWQGISEPEQVQQDENEVEEPQTSRNRTQRSMSSRNRSRSRSRSPALSHLEAKARKRDETSRKRHELEAELETLQQQFQEDLADVSTQYHHRRLRVEKKLRSLQSP